MLTLNDQKKILTRFILRFNSTLFPLIFIIVLLAFGRIALAYNAEFNVNITPPKPSFINDATFNPNTAKTLRVLTWSGKIEYLPRAGSPQQIEKHYIEQFAKQKNWQIEFIYKSNFADLIPSLIKGEGDVIVSNLTINSYRQQQVAFTQPIIETTEFLVMGKNGVDMVNADDLAERSIAVQPSTSYAVTAVGLEKVHPNLEIIDVPEQLSQDDTLGKVGQGEDDLTIVDDNILTSTLMYRSDLKQSIQANKAHSIGWAVAKQNQALKVALNQFLVKQNITVNHKIPRKNEWDLINERNTIRFVIRNNIASYYLWKGQLMGFHYELARDFAKSYNLNYEILVAPDNESMFTYIKNGKADIALGFYRANEQLTHQGLAFSKPYHFATEQPILVKSFSKVNTAEDIQYRNVTIRKPSPYLKTISALQQIMPEIVPSTAAEKIDKEQVFDEIAQNRYDITIADEQVTNLTLNLPEEIKPNVKLGKEKTQSWVIKSGNNSLLEKVDQYVKQTYRGLFYSVIHKRYFENEQVHDQHNENYAEQKSVGSLSPYDEVVEKYAQKYGFDSKLLIAQMHQESSFNPEAISFAGAIGLFQIMPNTAKQLKMTNLTVPENSIQAGVRYLHWVQERMKEQNVREDQLIWFALASYNAGSGHVSDAIRLAKSKGWQGDVWFDNVEKAMLLLSQQEYSSKARYGYVRGKEPVDYVRKIRNKYQIYNQQTEPQLTLQITSP